MKYYIKETKEMGRGLYASMYIKRGQIVTICELLVLNPLDTIKVNQTDLKWYTFSFNKDQDCLVLGDGEIFNHSDTANVIYTLTDYDGRKVMVFEAIDDVKAGDQLFINYSDDVMVDASQYVNKNLI